MTTEPSELRRLLDRFRNCDDPADVLFNALVTRLDALTEAKGAGPHVFRKGERVRIVRNDENGSDVSQRRIGSVGVLQGDPVGPLGRVSVLLDGSGAMEVYCCGRGCEVEPVSDAAPLSSGNLAAVTAAKIVQGGVWYVREEMYQSVEAERDEARAKLAEVESSRDAHVNLARAASDASARLDSIRTKLSTELADLRARLTAAESALAGERERVDEAAHRIRHGPYRDAGAWDARWLADYDSRRRATTGGDQYVPPTRYEKVVNMGSTPTSASGDPPSPAAPDFDRRVDADADDALDRVRRLCRRALKAEDEAKRLREAIQRGGSVNAAESQHGSGHREQVRASQAEGSIGRGQDRVVTADLRASGAGFDGAAPAGTGIGGRAHALGDGELLGERGDCSRVGSGGTVRGVTDNGAAPSPAAPDFERRIDALISEAYEGNMAHGDARRIIARRALKAEDEAKRLRDMIAEYVAAKSAGTSGPTSPSAVRLYRAERALKDAAQPEAGR